MAAASCRCLLTHFSVLLLGVWLHADVEASSCERDIHKKVGDTVKMSSCLPAEGVDVAMWKYGETDIARMIGPSAVYFDSQFKGRVELNLTDFSLTVRELTLQDSGDFRFVSEANGKQRETIFITLHVHEIITKEPSVTSNSTWHPSNESCTLHLECSVTSTSSTVTYSWKVKNQTWSGSSLNYVMTPQDGDTKFTCTVSNVVSETTTVITEECSNETDSTPPRGDYYVTELNMLVLLSAAGAAVLLIVVIIAVSVCVYQHKTQAGIDPDDLTVYADITEVANGDGQRTSSTLKACTLYETIEGNGSRDACGPQTVYDQIQLSRMRKASVSPYQEIS